MKQALLIILFLNVLVSGYSQGITLLYTGNGTGAYSDPASWIQLNVPSGQVPVQRAPTSIDDVVFSQSLSGIASIAFSVNLGDSFLIGGGSSSFCRSMHISNTMVSFDYSTQYDGGAAVNVYTTNGGYVLLDSGSVLDHGQFHLYGGNPAIKDLQVIDSKFGDYTQHNADWAGLYLEDSGWAGFTGSSFEGFNLQTKQNGSTGGLYAQNSTFSASSFILGDNTIDTFLNSTIHPNENNVSLNFLIGRNAKFVSSNATILLEYTGGLNFTTSGSVFNGNVSSWYINFGQEDPANPLPNIINGDVVMVEEPGSGISGDVKISGNFANHMPPVGFETDAATVFINGQDIFEIGGIKNFGTTVSVANCVQDYCHYKMEFFGNTNSNIDWSVGFPVDTLVINKTGCAKVTCTNSLYVAGAARINSGQLALFPNDTIPYKFVCAGNVEISQGGGIFLRRDSTGAVANMAVGGALFDHNTIADSTCAGISNPYNGTITLYKGLQNDANNVITVAGASNIGNLELIGQAGSDFSIGGNLTVNNFSFVNPGKLLLNDHTMVVNGTISNYGPTNYFVTNGLGKLQINNLTNIETVFPVGASSSSYTPAKLTNSGTPDNFSVNVQPQVLSAGTGGRPYIGGVVNRTWNINKSTPDVANVTVTLQWNSADELTGFTRDASYISHYNSGVWNNGIQMAASGSDPYSLTGTGITGFSPFAVMSPASVLPITLLDFTGKYRDKAIVLNWSTLTELNTRKFIIEKSNDAVTFRPLADIPAYGSSQVTRNYHYVDNAVLNDINYYRLKIVDINDAWFYSKVLSVSAPAGHIVAVFPNPVKDQLSLRLQDGMPASIIRIADAKGATVITLQLKAGTTNASINTKNLEAGAYSIIFNSGTLKETLQFIKE